MDPLGTHMQDQVRADDARTLDEMIAGVRDGLADPRFDGNTTAAWAGVAASLAGLGHGQLAGVSAEAILRLAGKNGSEC